jgi:hypothetical protein
MSKNIEQVVEAVMNEERERDAHNDVRHRDSQPHFSALD